MAFCGQCGTKFADGAKFCPACGAPAAGAAQQTPVTTMPPPPYQAPVVPGVPAQDERRDAEDNKMMAVLGYIFFLVPLFAAKESRFARYHTNQGMVLVIFAIVWGIVYNILLSVLYGISFQLGWTLGSIIGAIGLVFPVLGILGIIHACKGEKKPLPIIGGITILK